MGRLFLVLLLIIGLLGCAEGQKPNPLPRGGGKVNVEPLNPLPKEATK